VLAWGLSSGNSHAGIGTEIEWKACRFPGIPTDVQCGSLNRALDPAAPNGLRIEVRLVVLPALSRRKLPDPVFVVAGGPGQSAIAVMPQAVGLLSRLNSRRDLVFVDQRGTGQSAPLRCPNPLRDSLGAQSDPDRQVDLYLACRDRLARLEYVQSVDNLRYFTTPLAVQDLDAVRQALQAERINLVGSSYGTRVILEYQRQFPQRARRSVLDGVAPADMALPFSVATDAQASFEALMALCAPGSACHRSHPSLRQDWDGLLAGLPRPVVVAHPLTGEAEAFEMTRHAVLSMTRGALYSPALASALPQAISDAARGNFAGMVALGGLLPGRKATALAMGLHFTVVCAEDFPRLAQSTDRPGPDFGRAFSSIYERVCRDWPRANLPADYGRAVHSPNPVLILSGGLDPVTPPRHAERSLLALGSVASGGLAVHRVVPNAGHGVLSLGCMRDALFRFVDASDDRQAVASAQQIECGNDFPRVPAFRPVGRRPSSASTGSAAPAESAR